MDGFLILKVLTETFGGFVRFVFINLFRKISGKNIEKLKYFLKEKEDPTNNVGYINGFVGILTFLLLIFLIFSVFRIG